MVDPYPRRSWDLRDLRWRSSGVFAFLSDVNPDLQTLPLHPHLRNPRCQIQERHRYRLFRALCLLFSASY